MTLLLKPFELAINTALAQDVETQEKLAQFDQRCININISDIDRNLYIYFDQQTIQLSMVNEHDVDLSIKAKALSLAKLGHDPESLFSADIDIHGNVQFAKQLRDLLEGFDFDWEAQIAKVTGDTLAYPIAHGLRQFGSWLQKTHVNLQHNTAEYLTEEIGILPDKSQIQHYMSDIDTLRADFDRIEARINRL